MTFTLKSPAFESGAPIPTKYTADGADVSPPLEWSQAPQGAKSFLLVVEDPDAPAGTFRHWGVYNITGTSLAEGAAAQATAVNDFGTAGYRGPAPPRGHGVHHYHFKLAALSVDTLTPPKRAAVAELWRSARKHIIAETELVGTYAR
jgi:Raf kinase inhibitor-like YbhB/YbcL family protein